MKKLLFKAGNLPYLYPLLFAVFPLSAFYSSNIEVLKFVRIITPLEISIAFTIGLLLSLNVLIKDKYKASLLVTYFLFLFYSYGHVYNALEWFFFKNAEGENNIGLFSLWTILLIGGGFFIIKLRSNLFDITKLLNQAIIFLIIISLLQIFYFQIKFSHILSSNLITSEIAGLVTSDGQDEISTQTNLPDIYYIILDGYASGEVLRNIYGYDNSDFEDFLRDKGFSIAAEARSNYSKTILSLPSSLNMKYINYLVGIVGESSQNTLVATDLIRNNEVLKFLKGRGYKSVNFGSGWRATNYNKFADINIYCGRDDDLITVLLLTTMLRPYENRVLVQNQRNRVLCTFSKLASIREDMDEPIFVFSHIVSPHPPYVFGANGETVNHPKYSKSSDWESYANKDAYINQLKFVNKKVKELVGKLTAAKNNLPIIIIQADHGSASTPSKEEYNSDLIQERMRPFVATYLPGKDNFIPNSITPVNIFRLIFNNYFDTKYEILENKVYFSPLEKPYKFVDVTEEIWQKEVR